MWPPAPRVSQLRVSALRIAFCLEKIVFIHTKTRPFFFKNFPQCIFSASQQKQNTVASHIRENEGHVSVTRYEE
jgi:hypothetical protein